MTDRRFPEWQNLYRDKPTEAMPWFFAELDPDVEAMLAEVGITRGRLLDLGTGPGTQAIELAARGFDVIGTDIATGAIEAATARSRERGVEVDFRIDDVLKSELRETFDVIVDRGCFHVFEPEKRQDYVAMVAARLAPTGSLLLKCFSYRQPGEWGPYRFTVADIEGIFAPTFVLRSARETVYQGTLDPLPHALACVLQHPT